MPDPVRQTRVAVGVGEVLQDLAEKGGNLKPFPQDYTVPEIVDPDIEISGSKSTWSSIHDVTDSGISEFESIFSRHVSSVVDGLGSDVDAALKKGNIQEAISLSTGAWSSASNELKEEVLLKFRKSLVDSANAVASDILTVPPSKPYEINFRYTNPRATRWAREQSSHLIKNINEDQRTTIRNIITQGFEEQLTRKKIAKKLRSEIGLQSRQQTALENFRKREQAKKLSPALVDKNVAKYRKKLIRQRADSIARTELTRSANMGQQLLWEESIANGTLTPGKFLKLWIVTPDDRLCKICETYVGYSVEVQGTFEAPNGARLPTPPLHPMCRCSLALIKKPVGWETVLAPHQRPDAQKKSFKAEKDAARKKGRRRKLTEEQYRAVDPKMGVETKFIHGELDEHGNLKKDKNDNIIWTKDRQKLHKQIVDDVLADGGEYDEDDPNFLAKLKRDPSLKKGTKRYKEARKRPPPSAVEDPQVVLLGGGPASGKTVAANRAYGNFKGNAAKVDPDEIRGMLPEYKAAMKAGSPHGASMTHAEASHIAALARTEAQKRRLNLIKDGTGGGKIEDLKDDVEAFKERSKKYAGNDLKIVGNYVSIKTDEAVARMAHRAGATGRHVPEVILRNTHREVSESVIKALPKHGTSKAAQRLIEDSPFDEFKLWDNAEGFLGEPHLIYEWSRKKVDGKWEVTEGIVDPDELDSLNVSRRDRYKQFLDKAEEGAWGKSTVYRTAKEKRAAGRSRLRTHSARDK